MADYTSINDLSEILGVDIDGTEDFLVTKNNISYKITLSELDSFLRINEDAKLSIVENLNDLENKTTARYNLGVYSTTEINNKIESAINENVFPIVDGDGISVEQTPTEITISISKVGVPGTYTKVVVNDMGQVVSSELLTQDDIPELDGSKISIGSLPANRLPNTITSNTTGSALSAGRLSTGRYIQITGDIIYQSQIFDGTSNVTGISSLSNTGVSPGTYKSVTVDTKGRVISGTNPNTVDGYGIIDAVKTNDVKTLNGTSILGTGDLEITVGSGGYSANIYLTTAMSTTNSNYSQLSYTPDLSETILSVTINNNELLLADFIFDEDVKATAIPSGNWGFHFHTRASSTSDNTFLRFEFFKRSLLGVETLLFSQLSDVIKSTVFELNTILITQPAFVINSTDRVGVKIYASTTRTSSTVVDLIVGDISAAYFTTPLEIRHSLLRARDEANSHPITAITGLQDALDTKLNKNTNIIAGTGTKVTYDAKGLITSVETLIASDIPSLDTSKLTTGTLSVSRGGTGVTTATGTGNVVLSNSPTLVTPNIGIASGTSFNSITGLSSTTPVVAGIGTIGVGTTTARADHSHPAQTTITGNAGTATKLATVRSLAISGDITWSVNFDGSANVTAVGTLSNTGVTAGSYGSASLIPTVTVDTKGRITNVTTNTVSIPSGSISVTGGDLTMSGNTGVDINNATLSNTGVGAGTYKSVTVDTKGRITAGTNPTTLTGYGITDVYTKTEIDTTVNGKVDKIAGKQLSTEDYTTIEKSKLNGIADNANNYSHPLTHEASIITESTTKRFVSDEEKATWNSKQDVLVSGTNIKTVNGQDLTGSGNIEMTIQSGTKLLFEKSLFGGL